MIRYRRWFLVSASLLIFMGALLKLEHSPAYFFTTMAGIFNMLVFLGLTYQKSRNKAL